MACKKPIIVVSGKNTPIYKFLHPKKCSVLVTEKRNENFYKAILNLANNKNLRNKLGFNGYQQIIKNFTKEKIISQYLNLFKKL